MNIGDWVRILEGEKAHYIGQIYEPTTTAGEGPIIEWEIDLGDEIDDLDERFISVRKEALELVLCQETDCNKVAIRCWLVDYVDGKAEDFYEFFCPEHAEKHGYCYICGSFAAGTENFDFGRFKGQCDACAQNSEAEAYEDEEDIDYEIVF